MRIFIRFLTSLHCLILLVSCLEEVALDTPFKSEIFISGYLVNSTDYVTVKIQQTIPTTSAQLNPVNDAQVFLYTEDAIGNISLVTDVFDVSVGVYTTAEMVTNFVGNYYWIEVLLADGTRLRSARELLKVSIPITDIIRENGKTRVVFSDPANDVNFYQINFKLFDQGAQVADIYKFSSDVLYNGNANAFLEIDDIRGDEVHVNVMNLNYPTYQFYINADRQYADNIDNQVEEGDLGILFSSPPPHLVGNIINVETNETVLGDFAVFSYHYRIKYFESE